MCRQQITSDYSNSCCSRAFATALRCQLVLHHDKSRKPLLHAAVRKHSIQARVPGSGCSLDAAALVCLCSSDCPCPCFSMTLTWSLKCCGCDDPGVEVCLSAAAVRWEASSACDCWSRLNGSQTCSAPLVGLSLSDTFDPQRHDTPSVIAPCDPRQLSTQRSHRASDLQTSASQSQIMLDLAGAQIKGGDPLTEGLVSEALEALWWKERSEFQDSNNTC